jgi:hypothetical protein
MRPPLFSRPDAPCAERETSPEPVSGTLWGVAGATRVFALRFAARASQRSSGWRSHSLKCGTLPSPLSSFSPGTAPSLGAAGLAPTLVLREVSVS